MIDLNTCKPGQNLERRDGALVTYERKSIFYIDYPHLVDGEWYTDDGYYRLSRTEDPRDIVKIFPMEKPRSEIDLNTCVPGQKVKLRDETIGTYNGLIDENTIYKHAVDGGSYTNNGRFWEEDGRTSTKDVVEILPLEKESKPVTDLRTCVPGQKLRLRDGRISIYKEATGSRGYPHRTCSGCAYTDEGYYWLDKCHSNRDVMEILPMEEELKINLNTCVPGQKVRLRSGKSVTYQGANDSTQYPHRLSNGLTYADEGCYWFDKRRSDYDAVEILPLEEEPAKTSTELTHSITDQIDVTSPDHVSIIPHEHGVTISIKKGLTTISWRHSNS